MASERRAGVARPWAWVARGVAATLVVAGLVACAADSSPTAPVVPTGSVSDFTELATGAIGCQAGFIRPPIDEVISGPMVVTSAFGARYRPARLQEHRGIDVRARTPLPVVAAISGVVAKRTESETAGKWIVVRAPVPDRGAPETRYLHLSEIFVAEGQAVVAGQVIGLSGESGTAARGNPHLHFEYLAGGRHIDPVPCIIGYSESLELSRDWVQLDVDESIEVTGRVNIQSANESFDICTGWHNVANEPCTNKRSSAWRDLSEGVVEVTEISNGLSIKGSSPGVTEIEVASGDGTRDTVRVVVATNVALNKPVVMSGVFGLLQEDDDWRSTAWPVAPAATLTDGVFLPELSTWHQGTLWWHAAMPASAGNSVFVDLQGKHKILALALQADNNESYVIQYRREDGTWAVAWVAGPVYSFGMRRRSSGALDLTATAFLITGSGGDLYRSLSEFQAFGYPLP